jgi:hypothetical protein
VAVSGNKKKILQEEGFYILKKPKAATITDTSNIPEIKEKIL